MISWRDYFRLSNRERRGLVILFCILFLEIGWLAYRHFILPEALSKVVVTDHPLLTSASFSSNPSNSTSSDQQTNPSSQPAKSSETNQTNTPFKHYQKKPKEFILIDVATADTQELVRLPCIGPTKARIMAEYREKLGGFSTINQLHEVWGINDSIFDIIRPHVMLSDSTHLNKLNINSADAFTLGHHPYIKKNLSYVIVNYRKQHGLFQSIVDLKKIDLVTDELYIKIAPYLTVN